MPKVGILTFHYGYNYGGVLQAYALQQFLLSKGFEVEIINYIPQTYKISLLYGASKRNILASLLKIIANLLNQRKSKEKFDQFRNENLHLTRQIVTISDLQIVSGNFDAIIVGSDQIWNPWQHDKKVYFLDYDLPKGIKKISYAPCCAINNIVEKNKNSLRKSLLDFTDISVRNTITQDFVYTLIHKPCKIVLDPTYLWSFNELIEQDYIKEKYILTYIIGKDLNSDNNAAIKKIKNLYGNLPIYAIIIGAVAGVISVKWADKVVYDASPKDWLNYINNAELLFTDSFHGVVFAMKFRTKFIGYYSEELRASRFIDMKERYQLDDFIVNSLGQIKYIDDNQYLNKMYTVDQLNNLLLEESINFLTTSLH